MSATLARLLAGLPDTANGIAELLLEQECRGFSDEAASCPIAAYLSRNGIVRPVVSETHANSLASNNEKLPSGADELDVTLPPAVAEFVSRFDAGNYPELDLNTEMAFDGVGQ